MQPLTSKQKKYLKARANVLKPVVQLGKGGLNGQLLNALDTALDQHELVKLKFIAFKEEKEELLEAILSGSQASFVSLIGHVLTLYREQEDPQKRTYQLP